MASSSSSSSLLKPEVDSLERAAVNSPFGINGVPEATAETVSTASLLSPEANDLIETTQILLSTKPNNPLSQELTETVLSGHPLGCPCCQGQHQSAVAAEINEIIISPEDIGTGNNMSVGDVFIGSISDSSDEDWVEISFLSDETYEINLIGDTLSDPFLYLRDSTGNLLASNDDGGSGLNSRIKFTPSASGVYYLVADAYSSSTGTYALSVQLDAPATLNELASFLTEGYAG